MNKTNLPPIADFIADSEGFSAKPYKCTKGWTTIAYGRNLEAIGIRPLEFDHFKYKYGLEDEDAVWAKMNHGIDRADALFLLSNDIDMVKNDIKRVVPYFGQLPSFVQYVLLDMAFNVGVNGLKGFKAMIGAVGSFHMQHDPKSLDLAAVELLHSQYLLDVKTRAVRNAQLLCDDFEKVKRMLASRPRTEKHIECINKYGGAK